ncbi:hypothetical protein AURDEDRAFT_128298 [Auricularia subglabra TFB-10046 SS5]|nr:hypothetical protein AURDEDRAFT_128298 [Auricularia subglabra TFB-10046 SS5]
MCDRSDTSVPDGPKPGDIWWALGSVQLAVLDAAATLGRVPLSETMRRELTELRSISASLFSCGRVDSALSGNEAPTFKKLTGEEIAEAVALATYGGVPMRRLPDLIKHFAVSVGNTRPWPSPDSFVIKPLPDWSKSRKTPVYAIAYIIRIPIACFVAPCYATAGGARVQCCLDAREQLKLLELLEQKWLSYSEKTFQELIVWNDSWEVNAQGRNHQQKTSTMQAGHSANEAKHPGSTDQVVLVAVQRIESFEHENLGQSTGACANPSQPIYDVSCVLCNIEELSIILQQYQQHPGFADAGLLPTPMLGVGPGPFNPGAEPSYWGYEHAIYDGYSGDLADIPQTQSHIHPFSAGFQPFSAGFQQQNFQSPPVDQNLNHSQFIHPSEFGMHHSGQMVAVTSHNASQLPERLRAMAERALIQAPEIVVPGIYIEQGDGPMYHTSGSQRPGTDQLREREIEEYALVESFWEVRDGRHLGMRVWRANASSVVFSSARMTGDIRVAGRGLEKVAECEATRSSLATFAPSTECPPMASLTSDGLSDRESINFRLRLSLTLFHDSMPNAHFNVESMYRTELQEVLRGQAPNLELFELGYFAAGTAVPELLLNMALTPKLFGESPNKLCRVWLENVILPFDPIPAFREATEVYWEHAHSTVQAKFPCYLFDFFPKMRNLRMRGGEVHFTNSPLPRRVVEHVKGLDSLMLNFWDSSMPAFFRNLELHEMEVLTLAEPDEDAIYLALEPLRSHFSLFLTTFGPTEFLISVQCGVYKRIRHFVEAGSYYFSGSDKTNALLENDDFALQLSTLTISSSIWELIVPFLQPLTHLPKLVVDMDELRPGVTTLPVLQLRCPALSTLVLQTRQRYVHLDIEDIVAFADRITERAVALELHRVHLTGSREVLDARFASVAQSCVVEELFPTKKDACDSASGATRRDEKA